MPSISREIDLREGFNSTVQMLQKVLNALVRLFTFLELPQDLSLAR